MRILVVLFLISCSHVEKPCELIESASFYGTTIRRYQCDGYSKYCKYDSVNKQLGCFGEIEK